jgi:hypothetical protein
VSDIDTVVVDSLKALDLEWPIREADMPPDAQNVRLPLQSGLFGTPAVDWAAERRFRITSVGKHEVKKL